MVGWEDWWEALLESCFGESDSQSLKDSKVFERADINTTVNADRRIRSSSLPGLQEAGPASSTGTLLCTYRITQYVLRNAAILRTGRGGGDVVIDRRR